MEYQPTEDDLDNPCTVCKTIYDGEKDMTGCDGCKKWYHITCAGLESVPHKDKDFFCHECQLVPGGPVRSTKKRMVKRRLDRIFKKPDAHEERLARLERMMESQTKLLESMVLQRSAELELKNMEDEAAKKQQNVSDNTVSFPQPIDGPSKGAIPKVSEKNEKHFDRETANDWKTPMPKSSVFPKKQLQITEAPQTSKAEETWEFDQTINGKKDNKKKNERKSRKVVDSPVILKKQIVYSSESESEDFASADDEEEELETEQEFRRRSNNPTRIVAKQSLRRLPEFSGNLADWPRFVSAFKYSTKQGPFTPEENTARLMEFLKGKPLEMVEGILINPRASGEAMEMLEEWYGDANEIKTQLKKNVLSVPRPNERDKEKILLYATRIRTFTRYLEALPNNKYQLANEDTIADFVHMLPPTMQCKWFDAADAIKGRVTLLDYEKFVFKLAKSYKNVAVPERAEQKPRRSHQVHLHNKQQESRNQSFDGRSENRSNGNQAPYCHLCEKVEHSLENCKGFQDLRLEKRIEFVKKKHLCLTCFKKRHSMNSCNRNKGKESPEAHLLLQKDEKEKSTTKNITLNHFDSSKNHILFRVLPVMLYGPTKSIQTYAIIDDCSSITLMDSRVVDHLQLETSQKKVDINLQWTQNKSVQLSCDKVSVQISGDSRSHKRYKLKNVHTVPNLNLPMQSIDVGILKRRYPYLKDAEIADMRKARPLILLGLEHTGLGIPLQIKKGTLSQPVAIKTRLGWTIQGCDSKDNKSTEEHYTFVINSKEEEDEDLHNFVKYSFTTEAFGTKPPGPSLESKESIRANKLLETKSQRSNGRFAVPLLWKDDVVNLPESYNMALWRLENLEKKLRKDPELSQKYNDRINEYVQKKYAVKVPSEEIDFNNGKVWFLPHFPVINVNKPGKMRMVFDAAATVLVDGVRKSLNSFLLNATEFYTLLLIVLVEHRIFVIAVSGDIAEMFPQVCILEEDQLAQLFLWRNSENRKPDIYKNLRMIFGAKSSPHTSQWVKNKNAEDHKHIKPEAYEPIKELHYVDDYLQSFPSEAEAIKIAQAVKWVHSQCGFVLRNFVSNSKEVQHILNGAKVSANEDSVNLDKEDQSNSIEKVLGMHWHTTNDEYRFKTTYVERLKISTDRTPTKREFLRLLMSIFDPFGFLACYVVHGKLLLQDIWASKINWDQKLKPDEAKKYVKWITELPKIEEFKLPRCLSPMIPRADNIELHVFSDSSDSAFGTVIYIRVESADRIDVTLMGAKTKVAPTRKTLSIPRLELQGFLLGVRWVKCLLKGLKKVKLNRIVHWSDSRTVLSWINSAERKFNKFVECRVSECIDYFEEVKIIELRYVPSKLNVADETTKWAKAIDVSPTSTWIKGPAFLKKDRTEWPQNVPLGENQEDVHILFLHHVEQKQLKLIDFQKFSSYRKLQRCMAWVFRYIKNLKNKVQKQPLVKNKWLLSDEILSSQIYLIKQAQFESFPEEVQLIPEENQSSDTDQITNLPKSSALWKLTPIKIGGLLRVGGRIGAASYVSFDTRYPIILKKDHHLTILILDEYHKINAHHHLEVCVNQIRQKFWIPDLRVCVKKAKRRCVECQIRNANPRYPRMADLPEARLTPFVPPFTYTGMDLFGPIEIIVGRSRHKRWVVLYTCLTTRAIHMEVVKDLSTDSCILAYRCFKSIRPKPKKIFCDNGTNFVGMCNEMKAAWLEWRAKAGELFESSFDPTHFQQTEWTFIPPASPHMGGCWERMIRSVKNVLKVLTKDTRLHEDTLRGFLMEAMDIVNSRPLTYLPIENPSEPAITPNSILKLTPTADPPPGIFSDHDEFSRKHWRYAQFLADQFWKRWIKEYLPDLTRKTKWYHRSEPLKIGDVVIIVDDKLERNRWLKGRIVQVYPDRNGEVRFADVKTTRGGVLKRPTVKLAPLDVVNHS